MRFNFDTENNLNDNIFITIYNINKIVILFY
jgi:hypothetical protein